MKSGIPLMSIAAIIAGLGACSGKTLAATGSAATPRPAPDVYACVRKQIESIGFAQESHDDRDLRVVGRKYNETTTRPDVQFRRLVDRIEFHVQPAGGDSVTKISAQARTYAELMTHRGPTEQQEGASETAKSAARAVLDRCTAKP